MNQSAKTAIFWVFLILVLVILWTVVQTGGERPNRTLTFSEFLSEIEAGKVNSVQVRGYEFTGIHMDDGSEFEVRVPENYPRIFDLMQEGGVQVEVVSQSSDAAWVSVLINVVPFALLIVFWFYMVRNKKAGDPSS